MRLHDDNCLQTNSTIWSLFWWNLILSVLLIPVLVLVHCDVVEGNLAKLIYRVSLATEQLYTMYHCLTLSQFAFTVRNALLRCIMITSFEVKSFSRKHTPSSTILSFVWYATATQSSRIPEDLCRLDWAYIRT